jgi:hypothetical protein
LVKAWIDLTLKSAQDPKAGSWIAWLSPSLGFKIASTELWYDALNGNASAILALFYNITAISDSTRTRANASYVVDNEANNTYGLRKIFYDITVKASYKIAQRSVDIFYDSISALSAVDGAFPVLIWQHITNGSLKGSTRNGGNALGFDATGSPIHIIQLACSWNNAADDETVYQVMSDIMKATKSDAVRLGVQNDWVYKNYAAMFQDVIGSYGAASKSNLKTVSKNYDPTGVFQTLQPGYFKFDRAPVPDARYFLY